MDRIVKIFSSPLELAKYCAADVTRMITASAIKEKPFTIALSGGSTPELLFSVLNEKFSDILPWNYVHFFWGDERCVPPDNPESNYGMTFEKLLSRIDIPPENIHRIRGEAEPVAEALRYGKEISDFTVRRDGLPLFDLILLGLGEDGHTASIFPEHTSLFLSEKICEVAWHPVNRQKRITLTGKVINNAEAVTFLVTGKKKAVIVEKLFKKDPSGTNYPASLVVPVHGRLNWFLDQEAGSRL